MSSIAAVAVYATRYAVGRGTGAAQDVANFILGHRDTIMRDEGCRLAIIRDITEATSLGDEGDAREWRMVLEALGKETT